MYLVKAPKTRKWFPQLTKADLLDIMEIAVPQNLWPPRPTRQDANTIREVVRSASFNGFYGAKVREAIGQRIVAKRPA